MSLHLFTGEEWLRQRAITQLKRDLREKSTFPWLDTQLDGEEFPWQRFVEALETSPLFREGVIIHIKRLEKLPNPDALAQHLERPLPAERCVILEADRLDKGGKLYRLILEHGEIHDHPRPDRRRIPSLTNELLQERRVRLPAQGLQYFLESVENDLFRIAQEIEKLALYAQGREVSLADLGEVLFHDRGGDLFACLDALVERQPQALRLLKELLDSGEEPSKVFFLLVSQIRAILMVQSLAAAGRSNDEIAERTGDYPWRVVKRRRTAQRLSSSELMALMHRLHQEDLKIKRGERQPAEALWALAIDWTFPAPATDS